MDRIRLVTPFAARFLAAVIATHSVFAAGEAKPAPSSGVTMIELPGIQNAFRVSERIYSGSQPEGDVAFAELARLGVKTIISVDGTKPDVESARKFGLRYVHLPFGYDGIPHERVAQLSQAAKTVPGPIFVHCHHGKHRGPAAVGILCEASEGWTRDRAELWLHDAGTAADYPGLYRSVREFKQISEDELSELAPLPEITKTEPLVDAMVGIDERFDALKALQKAGWKTQSSSNTRMSPAQTATLLWEQYRELARTDDTAKRETDYRTKLADAENAADKLRAALGAPNSDLATVEAAFKQSDQSCVSCHQAFRNERK